MASATANAGLEILTQYVGNGSEIQIVLSDQSGKKVGKYEKKISGNRFWMTVNIPAGAKQALYADVKLPKHGLQMKSGPLIILPPVEITNIKWDKKEARRGDLLKLTADVRGAQDGTEGEIEIWEHDSDGAHDFITKIPVLVMSNKVEADWEYEYLGDVDEIPTEEEMSKYGNHYNPPEYFFRVKVGETTADSGLLEFKDWIGLALLNSTGHPLPDIEYKLILPDGSERSGKLDGSAFAREEDIPPGNVTIKWKLKNVPLF